MSSTRRHRRIGVVLVLTTALLSVGCSGDPGGSGGSAVSPSGRRLPAGVSFAGPERIVDGIELWRGHAEIAFGLTPSVARSQDLTLVRIDLRTPGLRFTTAPAGGPEQPPRPGHQVNTTGKSISQVLTERPELRLAMNANFFWPCCDPGPGSASKPIGMTVFGLSVDGGVVVSDPHTEQTKQGDGCAGAQPAVPGPDDTGSAALLVDGQNHVRLALQSARDAIPAGLQAAVAGGPQPQVATSAGCGAGDDYPPMQHVAGPPFLLHGGQIDASPSADPPEIIVARSFAGVSADGGSLYLATVDGGEQSGAAFYDEASWLSLAGAADGLNLDGGGSTTMALATVGLPSVPASPCAAVGSVRLLDVPYGYVKDGKEVRCGERLVGTYLGIEAPPGRGR